jgi:hypothetical protein
LGSHQLSANPRTSSSIVDEKYSEKDCNVPSSPSKIEDPDIVKYEYFYLHKWKKYNINLKKLYTSREEERLRILRLEEERKREEYLAMIKAHD